MAALREALDYALQAVIAIDLGDKGHARSWLGKGLEPSTRAFPPASREWFGLALVYGALLEAAAA